MNSSDDNIKIKKAGLYERVILIALFILGIVYFAPRFFLPGIPEYGHDSLFHVFRLMGLDNAFISPVTYNFVDTGSMLNVFYPWLTMYPMWIVYHLTGNFVIAYNSYFCLITLAGLYISYFSAKKITGDVISSFCFSVLYIFSSYRFLNMFLRGSLGEIIVMSFLPLVLCGIYQILYGNYRGSYTLCIGMTLIAYSHILSLYLVSFVLLLIVLPSIFVISDKAGRIVNLIKNAFLAVGLSLGSLEPILYYSIKDSVYHPDGFRYLFENASCDLLMILKYSLLNYLSPFSYGPIIISAILINLIFVVLIKDINKGLKNFLYVLVIMSFVLLIMISTLIPWGDLSEYSPIRIIQFPYRFGMYLTLFVSFVFSVSLSFINKFKIKNLVSMAVVVFSILLFVLQNKEINGIEPLFMINDDTVKNVIVFDSIDYVSEEFYRYRESQAFMPLDSFYDNERIRSSVVPGGNSIYFAVLNTAKGESIELPVCMFNSTKITVNGTDQVPVKTENGTVSFTSLSDGEADVLVYNVDAPAVYISWIVSFICLIIFCLYVVRRKGKSAL